VPQLVHLAREHCSGGISRTAYALWFVASLLILVHALTMRDLVFVALQAANAVATGLIVALASRYRDNVCAGHLQHFASRTDRVT
jgi:hypothetical protein